MNPLYRIYLHQAALARCGAGRVSLKTDEPVRLSIVIAYINTDTCPIMKVGSIDRSIGYLGKILEWYCTVVIRVSISPDKKDRKGTGVLCAIVPGHSDFCFIQQNAGAIGTLIKVEVYARAIDYLVIRTHVQNQDRIRI
jgi:hypothetical protein